MIKSEVIDMEKNVTEYESITLYLITTKYVKDVVAVYMNIGANESVFVYLNGAVDGLGYDYPSAITSAHKLKGPVLIKFENEKDF